MKKKFIYAVSITLSVISVCATKINILCCYFLLQAGEGMMEPPLLPSQSTQASMKCQRKTS